MPTLKANGIDIYYEVHGEGRPLVLILGLGSDVSENAGTIEGLARSCRVIAFDNRGAGRSAKPDMPYSIEVMAGDAAGLMEALDIPRAAVLGISLGGRIAMELALQHPDRVERLILVSTSARVIRKRGRARLWPILSDLPLFRSKHPQPRYAFVRQFEASTGYDATGRLGGLGMPVLILHGERDRVAPLALAEEIREAIPGARMTAFKGGHLFFLVRDPRRFLESVRDFVG